MNRLLVFRDRISNCESVPAETEPHTQIRSALAAVDHSRRRPEMCGSWYVASASVHRFWPQIRISIPHSPHRLPSEPGKLGHWRTINGCGCGAWSRGDSDRTRPSALYYSICSLCSAGQLAECWAWVNDPRQSATVNFRVWAVRISPQISRILADLRLQADASTVRTSLQQTAVAIGVVWWVACWHGDN